MTKNEFLALKNKHSYENQYKVKDKKELEELIKLAESIDIHMDLNWLDVSNVTNMCCMFENFKFNGDISKWDVSNVTNMNSLFENSKFNGNISKWNVSKIENANYFNPYLGINNKEDLENYMSFLDSIYNNKPIKTDVKKEWWKTKDLPLYIANKMNKDKEFVKEIQKVICK